MLIRKFKTFLKVEKLWFKIKKDSVKDNKDYNVIVDVLGGGEIKSGRKIAQICYQLKGAGFNPCIKLSNYDYLKNKVFELYYDWYGKAILSEFPIISKVSRKNKVLFVFSNNLKKYKNFKVITIDNNMENFKYKVKENFYYPLLLHPWGLKNYKWFNDEKNSGKENYKINRKIGLIFIGNNNENYIEGAGCLKKYFNCFSRPELIDFLFSEFNGDVVRPDSLQELEDVLDKSDLSKKILIIDKFRVSGNQFLELFVNSDFHIWMAGVTYPYCHNHIESMYCGTIPICQNNFYYYGLTDKKNSLQYSDLNGLKSIIKSVICGEIAKDDIQQLRQNVYELYGCHYSLNAYRNKLLKFLESDKKEETYYICKG